MKPGPTFVILLVGGGIALSCVTLLKGCGKLLDEREDRARQQAANAEKQAQLQRGNGVSVQILTT